MVFNLLLKYKCILDGKFKKINLKYETIYHHLNVKRM